MTAQEQQLIDELVDRIRSTSLQDKDAAAEQRLQQGLAGSPDALYILAQTVIVQKYGLEQAQQRIQAMQAELDSARQQAAQTAHPSGGSFLSHIFGGGSQPAPTSAPPAGQSWQQVGNPGYPQAAAVPPPPQYQGGYAQPSGWGGGGGGFLQSALQTAAGVAMGEVAFQGMESLFHGFGGGGYGGGYGRGFEGGGPSETIINNYNDGEPHHESSDGARDGGGSFYNPNDDASRDSETRDQDRHSFSDIGSGDTGGTDSNNFDDSENDADTSTSDDMSNDDNASSYDSGGDDGGGFGGGDDSN